MPDETTRKMHEEALKEHAEKMHLIFERARIQRERARKWEYEVAMFDYMPGLHELADFGPGWEVVAILEQETKRGYTVYFKREVMP